MQNGYTGPKIKKSMEIHASGHASCALASFAWRLASDLHCGTSLEVKCCGRFLSCWILNLPQATCALLWDPQFTPWVIHIKGENVRSAAEFLPRKKSEQHQSHYKVTTVAFTMYRGAL